MGPLDQCDQLDGVVGVAVEVVVGCCGLWRKRIVVITCITCGIVCRSVRSGVVVVVVVGTNREVVKNNVCLFRGAQTI